MENRKQQYIKMKEVENMVNSNTRCHNTYSWERVLEWTEFKICNDGLFLGQNYLV
jgi:hypothetical protein